MKKIGPYLFYMLLLCIVASCSKDSPSAEPDPPVTPPVTPPPVTPTEGQPGAAVLVFPANNSACVGGTAVNDSVSMVTFQWQAAAHTDSYTFQLTETTTGTVYTQTTTALSLDLPLKTGTSYKWHLVSSSGSSSTTTGSLYAQFYLAGPTQTNYAPFPAEAISPLNNEVVNSNGVANVPMTLKWKAADIDNDIASYTVYFDQADATTQIFTSQTATSVIHYVTPGKAFYWRVITKDKVGNSSDSGKFVFFVN